MIYPKQTQLIEVVLYVGTYEPLFHVTASTIYIDAIANIAKYRG
jgi:hypothetical protein